jgi:hypothetical protein
MAWMQRLAVATLAVLAAAAMASCSASPDLGNPVPDTCDGGPSVGSPEKAVQILIDAADQGDTALACTVTTGAPEGTDLERGLADLKAAARQRGVTAENAQAKEIGDTGRYAVVGPSGTNLDPLEFELNQVKDSGYRIFFPAPDTRNL